MSPLETRLDTAFKIARSAGEVLLRFWGGADELGTVKKGEVDLLTAADRASEKLIVAEIRARYAGDGIIGEEGGSHDSGRADCSYTWIIDPLDGTTNFVHGSRHFAVSIGIVDRANEPVAGVIHAPVYGATWLGQVGRGAFVVERERLKRQPIEASRCEHLSEALIATGFPYDRRDTAKELLKPVLRVLEQTRGVRRMGAACLDFVDVARGAFDGFFEPRLAPWDMAAGVALVRAAGGLVSDLEGRRFALNGPGVIAAGPRLHPALVGLVRGSQP